MSSDTRSSRAQTSVPWLITIGLACAALVATVIEARESDAGLGEWWVLALVFAGFLIGQAITLRLELGRQAILVSIVEIPFLISLFVLPPMGVLLTRLVAGLVIQVWRNRDLTKSCFNMALIAAGVVVANAVVGLAGPVSVSSPISWLVTLAAVLAADVVGYAAVSTVIAVVQGGLSANRLLRSAQPLVAGVVCAVLGLVMLLAIIVSSWAVLLLLALAVTVALGYRAYARFLDQQQSLRRVHELMRVVQDAQSEGELADILLERARTLLRAESTTLWLPVSARHPELLLSAKEGARGLLDHSPVPSAIRQEVVETGRYLAVGPKLGDERVRDLLRDSGVKDAIVLPLRSGGATIGCLEWANRLGDVYLFDDDDIGVMESLAAQTATAVENTRMVYRLRFDAYHDRLTTLPNRPRLVSAIEEAVQIAVPGEIVALMIFDVDGLRDVNESLGHAAGDRLLAEVGRRLAEWAPAGALVARVGGDEFGMLLRMPDAEGAVSLAGELRAALQEPMPFGTSRLDVDTAVGIAVHPDHGGDPETLLLRADLAANAAKGSQSAVQVFNMGMESRSVRRLGLAGDLRRAMEEGELEVHFQPKVAIGRRELIGVECLARWKHPAHGWVAPADFVPVAEHTGQLGRLTDLVLREGLRRCREWADEGHPLTVAVNLSPRTLADPAFVGYVEELIAEYGVPPERLTLEITEDGMAPATDRSMPTLQRIRELGVRLSVDDFGTGYSSLSYLRRLPVQEVKIDRTFVQGMATDPGDYAIVRAVVDLSRHFGLEVVAEGVESELALSQLEEIGCDVGQGFYFSRPLSYGRLTAWLAARTELMPEATDADRRLRIVP